MNHADYINDVFYCDLDLISYCTQVVKDFQWVAKL